MQGTNWIDAHQVETGVIQPVDLHIAYAGFGVTCEFVLGWIIIQEQIIGFPVTFVRKYRDICNFKQQWLQINLRNKFEKHEPIHRYCVTEPLRRLMWPNEWSQIQFRGEVPIDGKWHAENMALCKCWVRVTPRWNVITVPRYINLFSS